MSQDFTLKKYEELCKTVISLQYDILTVRKYLESRKTESNVIVLRHDVDRKVYNALKMARLENGLGICASYYFRKRKHTFKPEVIREIANLGHEIGYHYEVLVKAKGVYEKAVKIFENELDEFRKVCDIMTICAHGNPFSKWNNLDLWNKYHYKEFGLLGDASLSIDYNQLVYLSDTGRTWDNQRYNVRDRVNSKLTPQIGTTDELISWLNSRRKYKLFLQVHPERWADNKFEFIAYVLLDFFVNRTKILMARVRGLH